MTTTTATENLTARDARAIFDNAHAAEQTGRDLRKFKRYLDAVSDLAVKHDEAQAEYQRREQERTIEYEARLAKKRARLAELRELADRWRGTEPGDPKVLALRDAFLELIEQVADPR